MAEMKQPAGASAIKNQGRVDGRWRLRQRANPVPASAMPIIPSGNGSGTVVACCRRGRPP